MMAKATRRTRRMIGEAINEAIDATISGEGEEGGAGAEAGVADVIGSAAAAEAVGDGGENEARALGW